MKSYTISKTFELPDDFVPDKGNCAEICPFGREYEKGTVWETGPDCGIYYGNCQDDCPFKGKSGWSVEIREEL